MMIKPILFNTDMVRAILSGQKTVTRRVVKPRPVENPALRMCSDNIWRLEWWDVNEHHAIKVPIRIGDILYVRETFFERKGKYYYKADGKHLALNDAIGGKEFFKWRPSIHMPKEAARIFLRVTDVRVERLQDITEYGAQQEGATLPIEAMDDPEYADYIGGYYNAFGGLWDSTVKPADRALYGWAANPYVWVIEFERIGK